MSSRRRWVRVAASTGSSLLLQARGLIVQLLVWFFIVSPEVVLESVNWVTATVTLLAIAPKFGLEFTAVQFVSRDREARPGAALAAFRQATVLRVCFTLVVAAPLVLFPETIAPLLDGGGIQGGADLVWAGGLLLVSSSLYEYTSFLLTSTDNFPAMLAARLTYALVNIGGMAAVAFWWTGDPGMGVVLAQTSGGFGALLFGTAAAALEYRRLRERAPADPQWIQPLWGELLAFGLPLMIVAAAGQLFAQLDRVMMPYLLPAANNDLGYYGTAQSVASAAMFGTYAIRNIARTRLPGLFVDRPADASEVLLATYRTCLVIALWVASGALVVAPGLIGGLPNEGLQTVATYVPLFVPWMVMQAVANVSATALVCAGRPRVYAVIMGALALMNALLNILFIPWFGGPGAVLASTVSMVPLTILAWIQVAKTYEGLHPWRTLVSGIPRLATYVLMATLAGLAGWMVGTSTLEWAVISGVALTAVYGSMMWISGEASALRRAA